MANVVSEVITKDIWESNRKENKDDYSNLLDKYYLTYKNIGYYLQVGEINKSQGWILHISAVRWQVRALLESILPTLISTRVTFKVVPDKETARNILDGVLGNTQLGKVICIYPDTVEIALIIAKILVRSTESFIGPLILTDTPLGGTLFTSFSDYQRSVQNSKTKNDLTIEDVSDYRNLESNIIPFMMPKDVAWPFNGIMASPVCEEKYILKNKYKPLKVLKSDVKGNVIKSVHLKSLFSLQLCVIKQGRRNMWSDDAGRDIADRLEWQYKLHSELYKFIPLPKAIDIFTENGDTFLVLEYIEGKSLFDFVNKVQIKEPCWVCMSKSNKIKMFDCLTQIVTIIEMFHSKGYIHRDITPLNLFIKKKKVFIIDNELSYSNITKFPDPPFEGGTFGFMSPEQANFEIPGFKDDIYGLGACVLYMMSGLSPLNFMGWDAKRIESNIYFCLQDLDVSKIISSCLQKEATNRASLGEVKKAIYFVKSSLETKTKHFSKLPKLTREIDLKDIIDRAIIGLVSEPTVMNNDMWCSNVPSAERVGSENIQFKQLRGFRQGLSGILFCLGKAKISGFNISSCMTSYNKAWGYLLQGELKCSETNVLRGIYTGVLGELLAFVTAMDAGLVEISSDNSGIIQKVINISLNQFDLANGISGKGILCLKCKSYLNPTYLDSLLVATVERLIQFHNENKYWIVSPGSKERNKQFWEGEMGIAWFLIEYYGQYKDDRVLPSLMLSLNGIDSLLKKLTRAIQLNGIRQYMNYEDIIWKTTLGILLVYIKCYEVFQVSKYKILVEKTLAEIPFHITCDNYTQESGLSGIGEMYLEAYRVFKNKEWQERADWIGNIFTHIYHQKGSDGPLCWIGNNSIHPTADFMLGTSGIIHFLIRLSRPNKLGLPLLA